MLISINNLLLLKYAVSLYVILVGVFLMLHVHNSNDLFS